MNSKKVVIPQELHQKIIHAMSTALAIREAVIEKSFDNFLGELLERLAGDHALLRKLLSSGSEKNAPVHDEAPENVR